MRCFIFENTEFSSSFPIDGKEAKDLGLQGSATFTCLFLNRKKLTAHRRLKQLSVFNGIVCVKLAAEQCEADLVRITASHY
ncbi:hypothetical protein [Sphingobacterium corticibacterium]|uniref:Uncharacterized protein n=1 Tax=Sphingobacterium corticibacterium TaxID=2484746 RepID=A0A4Q6XTS9_9SPHI|nr:hypothetical protein [Sphingobacterium corticibacterium]RZF59746.1 hypothetical protein EWE74_11360 [Sphingobacterium corticibacterium]